MLMSRAMAELGDFLAFGSYTGAATKPGTLPEVPVEQLDYDYVTNCQSITELQAILQVLRSGKEGSFPQLERYVEARLMQLLPEKTRKQIGRLRQEPSPVEISEAEQELRQWQDQIDKQDSKLKMTNVTVGGGERERDSRRRPMPPVRGTSNQPGQRVEPSSGIAEVKVEGGKGQQPQERISGYDWDAWDKFDPEKVCADLDEEEQAVWQEKERLKREMQEREALRRKVYLKELGDLAANLGVEARDPVERKVLALREKQKGNECFRAGENAEAYMYYSKSLAWDPASAVVYGNRAMACVKLDRLEQAEADCTMALERDPKYTKVLIRRGTTRYRRGKYIDAVGDFEEALKTIQDPQQMKEVSALLEKAKNKYLEVEGERATEHQQPGGAKQKQQVVEEEEKWFVTPVIQAGPGPESCPEGWTRTLLAKGPLAAPTSSSEGKRQQQQEEETARPSQVKPVPGMRRVTIVEEEDDEEEEEEPTIKQNAEPIGTLSGVHEERKVGATGATTTAATAAAPSVPPSSGKSMTRVAIVEEDDEEEEEEQQQKQEEAPVAQAKSSAQPSINTDKKVRVPIVEEEEEEGDERRGEGKGAPLEAAKSPATSEAQVPREQPRSVEEPRQEKEEVFHRIPIHNEDDDVKKSPAALEVEQEAERLKNEGNQALQAGDVSKALALYTASIEKHPTATARNNRAFARLKLQDWRGAEEDATAVIKQEPQNVKALYRRGKALLGRTGGLGFSSTAALPLVKAAIQDMNAVLAIEPNNRPAKQEKQAAQQLLSKLQQASLSSSAPSPVGAKKTSPLAPPTKTSDSLLDTIKGRGASPGGDALSSSSGAALIQEVTTTTRAKPSTDVAKEKGEEGGKPGSSLSQPEAASKVVEVPAGSQVAQKELKTPSQEKVGASVSEEPPAPPVKAAAAPTSTTSRVAGGSAVAKRGVSVPKTAPKTLYEMESAWRSLKRDMPKFAQYLKMFKANTFDKVFKEASCPDVTSDVFRCVAEHMAAEDPEAAQLVMERMSRLGRFKMMKMMFTKEEKALLGGIFDMLEAARGDDAGGTVAALREKYDV